MLSGKLQDITLTYIHPQHHHLFKLQYLNSNTPEIYRIYKFTFQDIAHNIYYDKVATKELSNS